MPPVAEAALENAESHVADVIPEASKSGLPVVKKDFGVDEFWKDSPAEPEKKADPEPVVEPEKKAEVVTKDDAPPSGLAAKLAAKAKPAVVAPVVEPVKVEHPEDKLALDAKSSPKARENFDVLKGIARTERTRAEVAERKATEFQAKLDAASKAPTAEQSAELERLRTEHKAMSDKLLLIDTQNHPVFQKQYVEPRKQAIKDATDILVANGKTADLAALIEKPRGEIGKALATLLEGVPAFDQTEISTNIQRAYQLRQAEQGALSQARDIKGEINRQDGSAHLAAFDKTWDKVAGGITEAFVPIELPANATPAQRQSAQEYSEAVATLRDNARAIATGASSYESISEAAMKAAAYDLHMKQVMPRIGQEVAEMLEVIKAQKKEIDGYRSRNPNREISPSSKTPAKDDGKPVGIEEAAEAAWGSRR